MTKIEVINHKIHIYIGKKHLSNIDEYIQKRIVDTLSNSIFYDCYVNHNKDFIVETRSVKASKLVYEPCKIYYDLLNGKRVNGKVILTLV